MFEEKSRTDVVWVLRIFTGGLDWAFLVCRGRNPNVKGYCNVIKVSWPPHDYTNDLLLSIYRASKDLRCGIDEHSCHMWYGCSYIPHRRSSPPQNMVTFLTY